MQIDEGQLNQQLKAMSIIDSGARIDEPSAFMSQHKNLGGARSSRATLPKFSNSSSRKELAPENARVSWKELRNPGPDSH